METVEKEALTMRLKMSKAIKNNINRAINQHFKRKYGETEELHKNWDESKRRMTKLCILKNEGNPKYVLVMRGEGGNIREDKVFSSLDDALAEYNSAIKVIKSTDLTVLGRHLPIAKRLIKKIKTSPKGRPCDLSRYRDLNKLSFLFTVGYLFEHGFEMEDFKIEGRSRVLPRTARHRWQRAERVLNKTGELEILTSKDSDYRDLKEDLYEMMDKFSIDGSFKADTIGDYFNNILDTAKDGAAVLGTKRELESELELLRASVWTYVKNSTISQASGKGHLEKSEEYTPIDLDLLKKWLHFVSERDFGVFNSLIFSLSTGVRPTELYKLIEDPEKYLINGKQLDYKSGRLITKTSYKIETKDLANPSLSIISRVLIKNYPQTNRIGLEQGFLPIQKSGKKGWLRRGEFEDIVHRRLRTTTGHMIAQCLSSEQPQVSANLYLIKDRLGHVTLKQSIARYAKNLMDPDKKAEAYFGIKDLVVDGKDVSHGFPLWDSWLAMIWLKRVRAVLGEKEFKLAKKRVVTEYEQYRLDSGSKVSEMVSVSL